MVGNYVKLFWIRAGDGEKDGIVRDGLAFGIHPILSHIFFSPLSFAFSSFISLILWRTIRGDESFFSIGVYIRNASSNQSPQFSDRHLNMQKVELRFYFFFVCFFFIPFFCAAFFAVIFFACFIF